MSKRLRVAMPPDVIRAVEMERIWVAARAAILKVFLFSSVLGLFRWLMLGFLVVCPVCCCVLLVSEKTVCT